jgi:hypothetical protein
VDHGNQEAALYGLTASDSDSKGLLLGTTHEI